MRRRLWREAQTPPERTAPQGKSAEADQYIQAPLESVVQGWQRQRRSQPAMKGSNQQAAESDYGYSAAKRQACHDEDISEGEHNTPHFLPTG